MSLTVWGPLQRFGNLDIVHNIGFDAIPAPLDLQQQYIEMKRTAACSAADTRSGLKALERSHGGRQKLQEQTPRGSVQPLGCVNRASGTHPSLQLRHLVAVELVVCICLADVDGCHAGQFATSNSRCCLGCTVLQLKLQRAVC